MIHQLTVRSVAPLFILLLAMFFAACGSSKPSEQANNAARGTPGSSATKPSNNAPKAKLDLNSASDNDFLTIPGMTPRMVHEFMEYRPYKSITQFRKEMSKYV